MGEQEPVDLIRLGDTGGNGCVVRITGRFQPGVLTGHDILRADVLLSVGFVDACLDLCLLPRDLTAWEHALDELIPGGTAEIGSDRGLQLVFHHHDDQSVTVIVDYPDRFSTVFPIQPQPDWIEDHHRRLGLLRQAWPSEVIETGTGVYEWSPRRTR